MNLAGDFINAYPEFNVSREKVRILFNKAKLL